MKKFLKKAALIGLAGILAASCLTGCGFGDNKTLAKIGSEELTYGVGNFYCRFNEATYENYYSYYYSYYGGSTDNLWSTSVDSSGTTMESSLKSDLKDTLIKMYVISQNASNYGVSLSDEDEQNIANAADAYIAANDADTLKKVSGTKKNIEKVLELLTIQTRVKEAIQNAVDTNVTDEEAAQRKMSYVKFSYGSDTSSTDTTSTDTTVDEAARTAAQTSAQTFRDGAANTSDFDAYATESGYTGQDQTFDSSGQTPTADIVAQAMEMTAGQTSDVIEDTSGQAFYVVRLVSELDRDATDTQKQTVLTNRKTDAYDTACSDMQSALNIKWYDKVWSKISFTKLRVNVKSTTDSSTDTSSDTQTTLNTDTSLTVADGDKVNIDYTGTIDGVAFDGGSTNGAGADLTIGSGTYIDTFEQQLIGHKVGETVDVSVTFPSDYSTASLAGQNAVFSVTINGIYQ